MDLRFLEGSYQERVDLAYQPRVHLHAPSTALPDSRCHEQELITVVCADSSPPPTEDGFHLCRQAIRIILSAVGNTREGDYSLPLKSQPPPLERRRRVYPEFSAELRIGCECVNRLDVSLQLTLPIYGRTTCVSLDSLKYTNDNVTYLRSKVTFSHTTFRYPFD